jgi:phytoene dehydrogenase-like protein
MTRRHDAIVVGAGLGGLAAATTLAKNGLDVLLLERHNVPGGYASSFVRDRYEFEVSLHELSGIGTPERPGQLYQYLEEIGVCPDLEFYRAPTLHQAVFPDRSITLPPGREAYEETICRAFPHEQPGIHRFLDRVFDTSEDFEVIAASNGKLSNLGNPLTLPSRLRHLLRYLPTTWGPVLNRDVSDPAARAVLSQLWGYLGLPPGKISFVSFALLLYAYLVNGSAYPRGRSQALSTALLAAFERFGGTARLGCGVSRIVTAGGKIRGVITEQGERIEAPFVLSNADPVTTCRDLMEPGAVPRSFFDRLRTATASTSSFNVYLGVARTAAELGLVAHEVFVNADYDFDHHEEAMHVVGPLENFSITCHNVVYPDFSPPGTSIVVLTAMVYGEPWYDVPAEQYVDTKNRVAESMLAAAERVAPGLRDAAEVVEVSTPLTNMRYAGAIHGAIYGCDGPAWNSMLLRMGQRGPVDGLYLVGAWTLPGGGFEPAITTGRLAAAQLLTRLGKEPAKV